MSYFTKRYHPPGTPPGTLVPSPEKKKVPLTIRLVDYTDAELTEKDLISAAECTAYMERPTVTWIHVQGDPEPDTMRELGRLFELHPLALEDVLNTGQRPKLDEFDGQLFVVLSLPVMNDGKAVTEQVSLFGGSNYIISFHHGISDPFDEVRRRLHAHAGKMRSRGADYLFYALMDVVIDRGFPVLETFGARVEALEEELLEAPERGTLRELHAVRRELLLLRRMLWPHREVINALIRDDYAFITDATMVYLRDCYDHAIQIMELLETYREMTTSMLEVYLSSASNRLNEVMRVLTVIATIFIPLTFIVGVYGMNFGAESKSPWAMPELGWHYAYPALWLVMIGVAVGMVIYFKRKRWI